MPAHDEVQPRERHLRRVSESVGRQQPQAPDCERAILGAMIVESRAVPRALERLVAESFYVPKNQKIFRAICTLFERTEPVDLVTLAEQLRKQGDLGKIGGTPYLAELTSSIESAANVDFHAQVVAEKALLRDLIVTLNQSLRDAYNPKSDAFHLLDAVENDIFQISESPLRRQAKPLKEFVSETVKYLDSIHGRKSGLTGITSGFGALDALTGGWQNSDLIIIAGRPSMGKTALGLACARNAAMPTPRSGGKGAIDPTPVAIFSLEMSALQLSQRLLTSEARVNAQAARTGRLQDKQWQNLIRASGTISHAPIYVDDTPGLSILELRAKARRLRVEKSIGLIIVDYLQLMHGADTRNRSQNREQEIAQISRGLKALAKDLDIPVIALSQVNRSVETRGGANKRPQLSDLRESGSIEQDADVVAFIYRAEQYGIKTDQDQNSTEGIAEVIIGKQRNGPTGVAKLAFVRDYARFANLERFRQEPPDLRAPERGKAPDEDTPF